MSTMIQLGIVVLVVALAIAVVGGGGSSTNEGCTSSVPGFPLEVIQEQRRKASSKVPPSNPLDEVEIIVYNCAVDIPSKTDEQRFNNLRTWYQVQDELNPRLPSVENGAATLTSK